MKTRKLLILTCIALFTLLTGCKKDKAKEQNCKLLTVTTDVGSYVFTYDGNGRISTITQGNKIARYEYSGSSVIVNVTVDGAFFHKINATLNDNNLPVNIRLEKNAAGTQWNNYFMEYSGTQLIKRTDTYHTGSTPHIASYTWVNGNLVTSTSSSGTVSFTYDESKAVQPADVVTISGLLSDDGFVMIKNRNLVNSFNGMPVTYTFDASNKITGANIGTVASSSYQYTCN